MWAVVQNYNQLMKEFATPVNSLLQAVDLESTRVALVNIFFHFTKRIHLTSYPVSRAQKLVACIARDLHDKLTKILESLSVMNLS